MAALLYNRTGYSLMTSTIRIPQLVSFAVENGYEAIGITDSNVIHGFMELYHCTRNTSVKPLYGLEIRITIDEGNYPFVLYAFNNTGLQKLIEISTLINTENKEYSLDELKDLRDIAVIEIEDGSYSEHLWTKGNADELVKHINTFNRISNLYYGILGNKATEDNYFGSFYAEMEKLCSKNKIIAMPLSLYETPQDRETFSILTAIREQKSIDDEKLSVADNCHLMTIDEYEKSFNTGVKANTKHFYDLIMTDMSLIEKASLPHYPCPDDVNSDEYLHSLAMAGLKKRFNDKGIPERYVRRLNYELDVIRSMGFSDYFLIVWDVILYARRQNIYVGVGRGSVTGCLTAYCLGITHIDPLRYGLLFERFLNPERISMPDIDIDFPDNRREEVIRYVGEKYGHDHTAHILSFGTFGVRQLIRDVGKTLKINTRTLDIISKTVGNNPNETLKECYKNNEKFRQAVDAGDNTRQMYRVALKLEGLPRHYTTHAAGVVLSDRPLSVNCPCMNLNNTLYNTQYTMSYLEELGLIKMDFLSLRNLTTIAGIVESVNETQPLDILHIPLDDRSTYDLISRAQTTGVFQLESEGMKNLLRRMKPHSFEDLTAAIALFRPGPMENIPAYLAAREKGETIHYPLPQLEHILKSTYGIMVYQEQIMQTAQIVAGFSLGKADILRKAVSKKDPQQMHQLKQDFISGAVNNGVNRNTAEKIYDDIEKFGNYGFNKSHSVAYALLAYQLAYLKANFPLAFYHSLLNSVINDTVRSNLYIVECRGMGIKILPPDINFSTLQYEISENSLRFPLSGIKGIGNVAVGKIINERNERGTFTDYFSFIARCSSFLNRNVIEDLIKVGACDSFGMTRNTMLKGLDEALRYSELVSIKKDGQMSFNFGLVSKPLLTSYADSRSQNSEYEAELIGFFVNEHPVEKYRAQYPDALNALQLQTRRGRVKALCRIEKIREHRTKSGEMMCFADGYDEIGQISLVFMPDTYRRYAELLKKSIIVLIEGTVDDRQSVKVSTMNVLEG